MSERISIYCGPPVAQVLAGHEENRSGRINQVCADYLRIIEAATPELTAGEWCLLADVLNGTVLDDALSIRLMWASVADSDLSIKWEVNDVELIHKLRHMPLPGLIAIRDVIVGFWNIQHNHGNNNLSALEAAGAKIKEAMK